jgi:hypothetical protein
MPPDVDPAQAPWRVKKIRISWAKDGHAEESAVAYPVEVPMEIT